MLARAARVAASGALAGVATYATCASRSRTHFEHSVSAWRLADEDEEYPLVDMGEWKWKPEADPLSRRASDPPPPDEKQARTLARTWTRQESAADYEPGGEAGGSWPRQRVTRHEVPMLRRALEAGGGVGACQQLAFRLATALLGGTLCGHAHQDACDAGELAEGAALMRSLAEAGHPEGACGWAYCLANGDAVPEDAAGAARWHREAAKAGCAQSMHELGTLSYVKRDAEKSDAERAVRWFRAAAELGVPGSMFLLGECLLEGLGTQRDLASAIGWFTAAAELGHRGARARVVDAMEGTWGAEGDTDRYLRTAGRRGSAWQEHFLHQ